MIMFLSVRWRRFYIKMFLLLSCDYVFYCILQTYTGSILVAVNPYKMFNIYGLDVVKQYEDSMLGSEPPYVEKLPSIIPNHEIFIMPKCIHRRNKIMYNDYPNGCIAKSWDVTSRYIST